MTLVSFNLDKDVEYELVYDKEAFGCIKEWFSSATYEDASDFLREGRIAVSIPGVSYRDFFLCMLDSGYWGASFSFQLLLADGGNKDFVDLVKERLQI